MADWEGQFGDEYTARNMYIPNRGKFFRRFLKYNIGTVFEIGCNWGPNLQAWEAEGIDAVGCDVNAGAVKLANAMGLKAMQGMAQEVNEQFDLVFTVGVLIHQRTPELIQMMTEMVRLSSRYVFFAEYEGHDEEVPYRGERCALFKREFGKIFNSLFPKADLVESGFAGKELGFDDVTYWLYDISNCAGADKFSEVAREGFVESEGPELVGTFTSQARPVGAH